MKIMESYLWTDNAEVGIGVGLEVYHSSAKEDYILWYDSSILYLLKEFDFSLLRTFALVRAV